MTVLFHDMCLEHPKLSTCQVIKYKTESFSVIGLVICVKRLSNNPANFVPQILQNLSKLHYIVCLLLTKGFKVYYKIRLSGNSVWKKVRRSCEKSENVKVDKPSNVYEGCALSVCRLVLRPSTTFVFIFCFSIYYIFFLSCFA